MLQERITGEGKVLLLAGGGKIYTDVAARFVRSERSLEDIAASPYSREIVRNILSSGHRAALEFDFFLFAVKQKPGKYTLQCFAPDFCYITKFICRLVLEIKLPPPALSACSSAPPSAWGHGLSIPR